MPGLFFVGVHFLRTRKSALLMGVGEDADRGRGARDRTEQEPLRSAAASSDVAA